MSAPTRPVARLAQLLPRTRDALTILMVVAAASVALTVIDDTYKSRVLTLMIFWATVGASWNIVGGYAGQFSLGQAAFIGLGSYTTVLALIHWDLTPWIGVLLGAVVCAGGAVLIGIPTFRLRGTYFVLATLTFPLVLELIAQYYELHEVVVPLKTEQPARFMQFIDPKSYGWVFLGLLTVTLLFTAWLNRNDFGLRLRATRADQRAAQSVGINTAYAKLVAFAVSAAVAGMCGGVYIGLLFVVTPESVLGLNLSVQAIVVALVGGIGTLAGPVVGAVTLIPTEEFLRARWGEFSGVSGLFYGAILMVIVVFAPDGVIGRLARLRSLVRQRGRSDPAAGSQASIATVDHERIHLLSPRRAGGDPGSGPALVLTGVSHSYGGVRALNDVSVTAADGSFLAIVGPNGAGKTTLFDVITGFARPREGRVSLYGKDITGRKPHTIARHGLRRTFQTPRLFTGMTVRDNLRLGQAVSDPSEVELTAQILGLGELLDVDANDVSSSSARIVEIARALAGRPQLLLLDEPLAGLDWNEAERVMEILAALADVGFCVVIIEHTLGVVSRFVDEIVVLDQGAVLAVGKPDAIMEDATVVESYLGPAWAGASA